jgi:kynurenine formamidase
MTEHRYLSLGFALRSDAPSPPAIPTLQREPFLTIAKDGANVTLLRLTSHTGTHLDVPRHVFDDGLTVTDLAPADFIFDRPVVLDLPLGDCAVVTPGHLAPLVTQARDADFLLFRFGYGTVRRADPSRYSTQSPGFGVESSDFLRDSFPRLRGLGMDVPSLSCIDSLDQTFQAHHRLLGGASRRFIVVEDMNLDQDLRGLVRVIVAPLLVDGCDGGPCNVYGVLAA